jgi:hypothetical protein
MHKPNTVGRPPTIETDAAALLLAVFPTYQSAATEFDLTRSAVQLWASNNRIPAARLREIRARAAVKRTTARLYNRLGKPFGLSTDN